MREGGRSVPKYLWVLQIGVGVLAISAVFSACSGSPELSVDEQQELVLKYQKDVQSAMAMCQTTLDVAANNLDRFEKKQSNAVDIYSAMTRGWDTCGEQIDLVSKMPVPDQVNENVQHAYQRMGSSCVDAMQGRRDAIDSMRKIVNGDGSPAMIVAARKSNDDTASHFRKCEYEFERASNAVVPNSATPG